MIKKLFCWIAICMFCTNAICAPKKPAYADAEKMLAYFDHVIASTGSWSKKSLNERIGALRESEAIVTKAEKLFGTSPLDPGTSCREAAIYLKFYILSLNDIALLIEGRTTVRDASDLLAPVYQAVHLGERRGWCFDYVNSLDSK
jgi:hypothetical protein